MAIPEAIKPVWDFLYEEAVLVHAYWLVYEQLFGGPENQIDLLNRSAPFCFHVVQDALGTDVLLSLSKLSDPAESRGRTNATLQHLLNEIRALCWPTPMDELDSLWRKFTDSCAPIRVSRNKMIAHLDRATALRAGKATVAPIPPAAAWLPGAATFGDLKMALWALRDFMNAVEVYFGEPPTVFDYFNMMGQGGDGLLWLLRVAERYQELQREEKIPWNDMLES